MYLLVILKEKRRVAIFSSRFFFLIIISTILQKKKVNGVLSSFSVNDFILYECRIQWPAIYCIEGAEKWKNTVIKNSSCGVFSLVQRNLITRTLKWEAWNCFSGIVFLFPASEINFVNMLVRRYMVGLLLIRDKPNLINQSINQSIY